MNTITCIGHSGFAIETASTTLIFDYYTDHDRVLTAILERAKAIYVFVSHSHRDHLNPDIFGWVGRYPIARYIIANECRRKLQRHLHTDILPITFLSPGKDWSDGHVDVHAFGSTDAGDSFLVQANGKRIFHAGDLNCWATEHEQTENQRRKAIGDWQAVLHTIKAQVSHLDLAMFPVIPNLGGDFARGAREFLQAVPCDLFIPMHMWGRDSEATQFALYQHPAHGQCLYLPQGASITLPR